MPFFKDRAGQLWEFDNADDATRQGMVEASDADIDAHNHALDVQEADQGFGAAVSGGFQRGLGMFTDTLAGFTPPAVGSDAFGMAGPAPAGAPSAAVQPGEQTFPDAYTEQARLQREARPFASGVGGALAVAPLAFGAAAAAPGIAPVLGTTVGAIGAEAAVGAVQQEYDDAWFEQRPFELKQVAANTLMFAGLDFAFRGALKGIGSAMSLGRKAAPRASEIGRRNVVSEAQGAARELVDPVGGGSVGAARASDLNEPFDDAIRQMSDRDAAVLARDADAHYNLIAQDASESMTRLNNGLSDDLGNRLKVEDFATYASEIDTKTLEQQARWWTGMSEQADEAARSINALAEGDKTALDFGNLGKKATQTIDDFNRRISETADPATRNVLVDEFKKSLDRLTMSIDASRTVDAVTRGELKNLIAPTREALRKGLENRKLFGGAADLQKALNSPWHGLLEHWSKVQKTLTEETGHVQFDVSGAGRITRESTVDRMLALLSRDPRSNQEFGRHLAGTLENIQGLIDARGKYGIARKDGLDALEQDIRNLMEDWNLAQTIGIAKNRVDALKKDPRKWGTLALNLGERLPIVGQPIQLARTLGDAFTDLHIQRNTPLARVWDSAYKRYALNPVYSDPSIIRNYPDWIAESLRNRGGNFNPPAGGISGAPAVPGMPPANEGGGARSVAAPAARSAIDRARARISQSGHVTLSRGGTWNPKTPIDKLVDERLRAWADDEVLAEFSGKGDLRKYLFGSVDNDPEVYGGLPAEYMTPDGDLTSAARKELRAAIKSATDDIADFKSIRKRAEQSVFGDAGLNAIDRARDRINQSGHVALGGRSTKSRDQVLDALERVWTPEEKQVAHGYTHARFYEANEALRGLGPMTPEIQADVDRLNALFGKAVKNGATFNGTTLRGVGLTAEEAAKLDQAGILTTQGFMSSSTDSKVAEQFTNFGSTSERDVPVLFEIEGRTGVPIGRGQAEVVHRPGTQFAVIDKRMQGDVPVYMLREMGLQPGAPSDAILGAVNLGGKDGANFSLTDIAKSPMGVVTGAGAAGLAINAAVRSRAEEPPTSPDGAYRDALREIDQAGKQQVSAMASEALKMKLPRGKDRGPLALFAGKGSIQDAVEQTRERLDEIAADPTTLLQQIGDSSGALSKTHPSVQMAVIQKAAEVAAYLQSVIPQKTATTLLDSRGAPLSFDRAWDYAARYVGATQPRAALREIVRGSAPPEMLEAVQATWPEVWSGFQAEMLGQVQRMHAAGRHIPSEKLRRLDRLLGLGGQLDPSSTLEVSQHMLAAQDAEAARRQQQAGAGGGGGLPSGGPARAALRTKLGAISAER